MRPSFEHFSRPMFHPADGSGVNRRRGVAETIVGQTDEPEQIGVKISLSDCDKIDEAHGDPLLQQGRTLGYKEVAVLRSVLVGRADDLDRGDEATSAGGVVYAN